MNTTYFSHCEDVAAIKSEYKKLALRWHPDRPNGNTAIMQEINAAYKRALAAKHGETTMGDDGQEHTYYYKAENEQAIIDKISAVIQSGVLTEGVELWLVGTWLWIMGDTYPHKAKLGKDGLGFTWNGAPTRKCWQWHLPTFRKTTLSADGFESIAARYGARMVAAGSNHETALAA